MPCPCFAPDGRASLAVGCLDRMCKRYPWRRGADVGRRLLLSWWNLRSSWGVGLCAEASCRRPDVRTLSHPHRRAPGASPCTRQLHCPHTDQRLALLVQAAWQAPALSHTFTGSPVCAPFGAIHALFPNAIHIHTKRLQPLPSKRQQLLFLEQKKPGVQTGRCAKVDGVTGVAPTAS